MELLDRYKGALIGLAVGDALGTTVEFSSPGTFEWHTEMVGGGAFSLKPGQWTDDTSMALCLADSLIECKKFDAFDQLDKYVKWYRKGYNSPKNYCFDIGNQTRDALEEFEHSGIPYTASTARYTAGNGSLMRLAPVPLFFYDNVENIIKYSAFSSKTTHAAPQAIDSCKYFGVLLYGALNGLSKEELLLSTHFYKTYLSELDHELLAVLNSDYATKQAGLLQSSGYVIRTMEVVLWAFSTTDNFEEGLIKVVNLGDDADTAGAVYGQIAGAYYGVNSIPERWLEKLFWREEITNKATELFNLRNPAEA